MCFKNVCVSQNNTVSLIFFITLFFLFQYIYPNISQKHTLYLKNKNSENLKYICTLQFKSLETWCKQ